SLRRRPAGSAPPAAKGCPGRKKYYTPWSRGREQQRNRSRWTCTRGSWGRAIPSARWRPALWSPGKARLNISGKILSNTFTKKDVLMATIHIDGQSYEVKEGRNLLETCLSLGLDLPYFCWHPALGSVGACRQCAVKSFKDGQDTRGKLVMSCMEPVKDQLRISISDKEAATF